MHEQLEKSVETNNVLAMGRQIKTLTTKVSEIHEIKVKIQELKIETAKISRIYTNLECRPLQFLNTDQSKDDRSREA